MGDAHSPCLSPGALWCPHEPRCANLMAVISGLDDPTVTNPRTAETARNALLVIVEERQRQTQHEPRDEE